MLTRLAWGAALLFGGRSAFKFGLLVVVRTI
ncbi:hypothetical protein LINGRAHAP2_LOCUS13612 [Linum grandiflorum]